MSQHDLPVLTGEKTVLRPITSLDTPFIVKWRNTPEVREQFIFREVFTAEIHERWLNTKVASGEVVQYIIEDTGTGKPVGSVYFRDVDMQHKSAEYGIFIGEGDARGKGLGTEAARLFIDYGFRTLGLHRISLRVLAGNERAHRSYIKAGFKDEGLFRDMVFVDGAYHDVIFMAVLSNDD